MRLRADGEMSTEGAPNSRLRASSGMTVALRRLNQWYGLIATEHDPITHEQLERAALNPVTVDVVRRVFETGIRGGIRVEHDWLTPEVGGEVTIGNGLRFVEANDPRWRTARDLAVIADEPARVAALARGRAAEVTLLDRHGLLNVALQRLRLGSKNADREVARAVRTMVRNSATEYSHDPVEQFRIIVSHDWSGRYVGRWHTHPPHDRGDTWGAGEPPSFEDMENAVRDGQYLTLAFHPDGFDLYDAADLADEGRADLRLMRVIRYRSPAWRAHFRRLRTSKG